MTFVWQPSGYCSFKMSTTHFSGTGAVCPKGSKVIVTSRKMNESGFALFRSIVVAESAFPKVKVLFLSPHSSTGLDEERSLYFLLEHLKIQAAVSLNDLFTKDKFRIEFYQDLLTSCLSWSVNRGQIMLFDMITVTTSSTECTAFWACMYSKEIFPQSNTS